MMIQAENVMNRRVEIAVFANEKLKDAAESRWAELIIFSGYEK